MVPACLIYALSLLVLSGPPKSELPVVPKGDRSFGLVANLPQDGDFGKAFFRIKGIGGSVQLLSLNWTDIETAPGKIGNPFTGIANAFYPLQKTRLLVVLRPINTNRKEVPADLADKPFDDPAVIERFTKVLDYLFAQTPQVDYASLAIGNEVDDYFGGDAARIAQYRTFYEKMRDYARAKRPGLRVGVVVTMNGLTGPDKELYRALNTKSDVILTTYYPLNADFSVRSPEAPRTDIPTLVSAYPNRPILFTEAGYPSSSVCGSSEEKQAGFVRNIFATWDRYPKQIEILVFNWLSDQSPESVKMFEKYYGANDARFGEFLRTLGFRTYPGSGTDKPAFAALGEEAKRRGWK